jgi:general secretion pathway protein J
MTLLELLVVLMLVSMLATILIQGVGFFLDKYEAVQRVQNRIAGQVVRRHWFVNTVKGLIPYHGENRAFVGEASTFTGVSMQALASEPGRPASVSWQLDSLNNRTVLRYSENNRLSWEITALDYSEMQFLYADTQQNWFENWPQTETRESRKEKIPSAIMLATKEGEIVWIVKLPLFPRPVESFSEG